MALSNWDTMALDEKGKPTNGVYTSPLGITFEFYKNWIYVRDKFVSPTVMEITEGKICYLDTDVLALRGPQNGVYAINHSGYGENVKGMIGCGVYGYDYEDWVGVKPESLEWFRKEIRRKERGEFLGKVCYNKKYYDIPNEFLELDFSKALRFNQGDAFFGKALKKNTPATQVGKSKEPVLNTLIKNMK